MRRAAEPDSTAIGAQPIRFIRQLANPGKPTTHANHRSNQSQIPERDCHCHHQNRSDLETQGRKPVTTLYDRLAGVDDGELKVTRTQIVGIRRTNEDNFHSESCPDKWMTQNEIKEIHYVWQQRRNAK